MKINVNSIFLVSLTIGMIGFSVGGLGSAVATNVSWFFLPMILAFTFILTAVVIEQLSHAKLEEAQKLRAALAKMSIQQAELRESRNQATQVAEDFTSV